MPTEWNPHPAGPSTPRPSKIAPGGVISGIERGSVAESGGLRPGDRILAVNGRPLWDVLDYQFYAADADDADLLVERAGQTWSLKLPTEDGLGIHFGEVTFDGIRRCSNKCPFCFVHQNPRGARKTLFIKDDDYRYSAMYGGFVTLTNLDEDDWRRIGEQHLSPLNVSVHATELDVRRLMLGNAKAPDILEQLRRLFSLGIKVNTQVVLCPGMNDGEHLDRTISDLAALYPDARTLSVVPVGLTDHGIRKVTETRRPTPEEARVAIGQIEPMRRKMRREHGVSFVHPSDELYLLAGRTVPSARYYDGFPQYSNGVGMVRSIQDELARLRRRERRAVSLVKHVTAFCGTLAGPLLASILGEAGDLLGCQIDVVPVENQYFGPSVTVSGLLTGNDVIAGLKGRQLGEVVLAPGFMLDVLGARFLDDLTPPELVKALGRPVRFASTLRQVARELTRAKTPAAS